MNGKLNIEYVLLWPTVIFHEQSMPTWKCVKEMQ